MTLTDTRFEPWRMDFKHHLEQKSAHSDDSEREDDEYDEEGAFRGGFEDDEGAESLRMSQVIIRNSASRPLNFRVIKFVRDDYTIVSWSQVDWLRRGQLCERLGRVEDAERAYRVCVHDDANFTAWWGYRSFFFFFKVCAHRILMFSQQ